MALSQSVLNACRQSLAQRTPSLKQVLRRNVYTSGRRFTAENIAQPQRYRPSSFDKRVLVWAKMHNSVAEVPEKIALTEMKKAQDWLRVRLNIYMLLASAIMGAAYIYVGRTSSRQGRDELSDMREQEFYRMNKEESAAKANVPH